MLENVFVPDAAIAARRKPDVWHPLLHLVVDDRIPDRLFSIPGIAETARDIAVAEANGSGVTRRRDGRGELETELAATRMACDAWWTFAESATPGPETTNTVFIAPCR